MSKSLRTILSIIVILTFVIPVHSVQAEKPSLRGLYQSLSELSGIERARISWSNAYQARRLEKLGVKILERGENWALVLATAEQMETLARLRYEMQEADDLGLLLKDGGLQSPQAVAVLQPVAQRLSILGEVVLDESQVAGGPDSRLEL